MDNISKMSRKDRIERLREAVAVLAEYAETEWTIGTQSKFDSYVEVRFVTKDKKPEFCGMFFSEFENVGLNMYYTPPAPKKTAKKAKKAAA